MLSGLAVFYLFVWSALASEIAHKEVFIDAPPSYFGFHYMLPLSYYGGIPDSLVADLRSIFEVYHANPDATSFQKAQERYSHVITALGSVCQELCANKSLEAPPHPFLKVDETFCYNLRSQMLNWLHYMSFNLPNRNVFLNDNMHRESFDKQKFELKLAEMANEAMCKLEIFFDMHAAGSNVHLPSINSAFQAMADICRAFKVGQVTEDIVKVIEARFKRLLSRSLRFTLPPLSGAPVVGVKGIQFSMPQMNSFLLCRYTRKPNSCNSICVPDIFPRKSALFDIYIQRTHSRTSPLHSHLHQ